MSSSCRRGFLRATLGSAWACAGLLEQAALRASYAMSQANSAARLPDLFDIEQVAPGVFAAVARPAALINCNAAIFENEKDLLVVDTHSKPSAAVTLISQLRRTVSQKPIRYIVNSHFHWDHTQGTSSYRRIALHADVLSSETTRRLISENAAARLNASLEETQKALDTYKSSLAAARSDADKAHWQRMLRESREYLAELKDFKPELPNVTFDRDLIIRDKVHDLHLAFRGRGHTAGDVVVWCPQKKVLASGDLLHGFAPFIGDGYPREWPQTLRAVAEFPYEHAIGGHGGVQHTRSRLAQMARYIEEIDAIVRRACEKGLPIDEVIRGNPPSGLASLSDGGYGQYIAGEMLKLRPQPSAATPASVLAAAVAANFRHVLAALERS
jgi:glyoxylase-like metal-dependent hydrolase (beta-lactamase superfamily II)